MRNVTQPPAIVQLQPSSHEGTSSAYVEDHMPLSTLTSATSSIETNDSMDVPPQATKVMNRPSLDATSFQNNSLYEGVTKWYLDDDMNAHMISSGDVKDKCRVSVTMTAFDHFFKTQHTSHAFVLNFRKLDRASPTYMTQRLKASQELEKISKLFHTQMSSFERQATAGNNPTKVRQKKDSISAISGRLESQSRKLYHKFISLLKHSKHCQCHVSSYKYFLELYI